MAQRMLNRMYADAVRREIGFAGLCLIDGRVFYRLVNSF